ncbi:cobalt-precorrin-3B C(17)-methyltransferase [Andreesenia angusta]|uniref:Cobalt-precorrin-3B C(17)-methyltransferase n=1 Tax=Andreesenia angusta TaxID=39480 RepID=A0A1S1VA11_9FIRM|nr:precorrin-3B C(17)-methyltransferase [Andreesenia angusta]OHW63446.1 cobalt-precorrin-3B C(17)-methyltransferase [Andreesenia angusta]
MAKLYVVGIGPGGRENMTLKALKAIEESEVLVGYSFYIELLGDLVKAKEVIKTGMRGELERCKAAIESARAGKTTAIVSTGDSGLYGMAGPIHEMAEGVEIEVVPGISSAFSAAAELGAPIMHDFCTISLSDLLTPWETIESRLEMASKADFVIALYNPKSKTRTTQIERAFEIIREHKADSTPVGIVKNSGRFGKAVSTSTLGDTDFEDIDMMTVVIVGNKETYFKDGNIVTPRGYSI